MSELRLNLITREWVIIATERAKRPKDFKKIRSIKKQQSYLQECPFCLGNEAMTPPETYRVSGGKEWTVRVTPNKFPALSSSGTRKRHSNGVKRLVTGVGVHEVIIETPLHNSTIPIMPKNDIIDVIKTYKNRFINAHSNPNVGHVIIFKNHGPGAGTSLEHPHSQLIGSPVTPIQVRDRMEAFVHFFDDTGRCLLCKTIDSEKREGTRVILETEHFLSFIPYAALSPFHTWIFPKRHSASFSDITGEELEDLATNLKTTLAKLYYGLEDPNYNYVLRSNRPQDCYSEYYHWYISIVPRLSMAAGFELGSGMYINTTIPEESAEFLRKVKIPK
jgi:UDPglucose--hexose-1-phosphate uridylyltransferase